MRGVDGKREDEPGPARDPTVDAAPKGCKDAGTHRARASSGRRGTAAPTSGSRQRDARAHGSVAGSRGGALCSGAHDRIASSRPVSSLSNPDSRRPWGPSWSRAGIGSRAGFDPPATRTPRFPAWRPRCWPASRSRWRTCRASVTWRRSSRSSRRSGRTSRGAATNEVTIDAGNVTRRRDRSRPRPGDPRVAPARGAAPGALRTRAAPASRRRRDRQTAHGYALPGVRGARRARVPRRGLHDRGAPSSERGGLFLDEPSVTGTENAVMAAVRARGTHDDPQRGRRAARAGSVSPPQRDGCAHLRDRHARAADRGRGRARRGTRFRIGVGPHRGGLVHRPRRRHRGATSPSRGRPWSTWTRRSWASSGWASTAR